MKLLKRIFREIKVLYLFLIFGGFSNKTVEFQKIQDVHLFSFSTRHFGIISLEPLQLYTDLQVFSSKKLIVIYEALYFDEVQG